MFPYANVLTPFETRRSRELLQTAGKSGPTIYGNNRRASRQIINLIRLSWTNKKWIFRMARNVTE